jgi:hypothetical protein
VANITKEAVTPNSAKLLKKTPTGTSSLNNLNMYINTEA